MEQGGRTASEAFEDVGHSSDAREMMKKFKIGEIIESERTTVNEKSTPDWATEQSAKEDERYYCFHSNSIVQLINFIIILAPIANGCYR